MTFDMQYIHVQNVRVIARSTEGVCVSTVYTVDETFGGLSTKYYPPSTMGKMEYVRRVENAIGTCDSCGRKG